MDLMEFVTPSSRGPRFSVPTEWREEYGTFLRTNGIPALMVNTAHGFVGRDLNFLAGLQFLISLDVLAYQVVSIKPIEHLTRLLSLSLNRTGDDCPDFSYFPVLEKLFFQWRKKSESVFECKSLLDLYVTHYPGHTSEDFVKLSCLKRLKISVSPTMDIGQLQALTDLEELGLFYLTKLSSLDGVQGLTSLQILNIETCKKITSLEPISNLTNLRKLCFANCGEIESIEPLRNLKELEIIHFWESTNVLDGDLSPLTELPNLKDVRFMNRKHYSLRCEQFAPFGENPEYPKKRP